jgi:Sec-independent protein translocase protein TatA
MIGAIIAALLIWGPHKIPELAKSLGEAKHELETASKGNYETRDGREIPNLQRLPGHDENLDK